MTEDEVVGWHHRLDGHEFGKALGVGDGQGSLACCHPWGRRESDTTDDLTAAADSTYKWDDTVFVFCVWLISVSIMSSRSSHVATHLPNFSNAFDKAAFPEASSSHVHVSLAVGGKGSCGPMGSSLDMVSGGFTRVHSGSHDCNHLQQLVPCDFLIFQGFSPGKESFAEDWIKSNVFILPQFPLIHAGKGKI